MADRVEHLVLHSGIPGRVVTALVRSVAARQAEFAMSGVSIGAVATHGRRGALDRRLVATVPGGRRARHVWISSAALLGTQRLGSADRGCFRPEAERCVADVIGQLQPRATSVVIETLPPELVLQLAYERAVREGETAAIDDVFTLDHPWVDVAGLRSRLEGVPTVSSVSVLGVDVDARPDPHVVFEAAGVWLPRSFWSQTVSPEGAALRRRATMELKRLPPRLRPRFVRAQRCVT